MNTFNPQLLVITINGVLINGFAKGDFFSCNPRGPRNSAKEGALGDVSVSVLSNTLYDITIKLLHGSPVDAQLAALDTAQRVNPLTPAMPFVACDPHKPETYTGKAWFEMPAGTTWGDEGGDHEWKFGGQLVKS